MISKNISLPDFFEVKEGQRKGAGKWILKSDDVRNVIPPVINTTIYLKLALLLMFFDGRKK